MKRTGRILWAVLVLAAVTLACSFGSKPKEADENNSEPAEVQSGGGDLGEEFRNEAGGFSLRKAPGYNFQEAIGILNMTAPDATPDAGPGLMVVGGMNTEESTNEQLMEKVKADSGGMQVGKAQKIKVDGLEGLSAEISGEYNGQTIAGRMVVVMVTPLQQFTMLGIAPKDRWKGELEPIFKDVLASVEFFEANPEAMGELEIPAEPAAPEEPAEPAPTRPAAQEPRVDSSGLMRQWASSAKASSEFGNPAWSAMQAAGAPDTTECGDQTTAWASMGMDTVEWLEVYYDVPVYATEVIIHQTYNPSQVVKVELIDTKGQRKTIFTETPAALDFCPDEMSLSLRKTDFLVSGVRITVDQSVLGLGWNEIDAVELAGYPGR